ncbi:TIGR01906 family membrane protein [Oribacterium sp. WCC10]|uniref:TIGR01906 family membrane protein n=1 Tax=Oribacterium sp. WCC10 TaxID=1855343 RepID=UPI0008F3994B|nr:TIGR01906 family membrane protein [Oribacterium sp. WCC10]SFG71808.1 integral membrane protein TIGR01906 [Oribacterium sp. WCC10]
MKIIHHTFLGFIFSIMLIFINFVTSFEAVCYWTPDFYRNEFIKYDVTGSLKTWMGESMKLDDMCYVIDQTMVYLRGDRENLIIETNINGKPAMFYNENEKSHMADVRDLFVLCIFLRAIFILSCIAIAGYLIVIAKPSGSLYYLSRGYIHICLIILFIVSLIGILAAADFTKYFTIFHQIFFSQGNWLFDPRESRMINMLPEGFFSDCALKITFTFIRSVIVLLVASILAVVFTHKKIYK